MLAVAFASVAHAASPAGTFGVVFNKPRVPVISFSHSIVLKLQVVIQYSTCNHKGKIHEQFVVKSLCQFHHHLYIIYVGGWFEEEDVRDDWLPMSL